MSGRNWGRSWRLGVKKKKERKLGKQSFSIQSNDLSKCLKDLQDGSVTFKESCTKEGQVLLKSQSEMSEYLFLDILISLNIFLCMGIILL